MTIDLQPFCSKDEARYYLHTPFSFGDFTYATNGHLLVRVPRLADISAPDGPITSASVESVLVCHEGATFSSIPPFALPAHEMIECDWCEGSGKDEFFDDLADDKCDECAGTGKMPRPRTMTVRGVIFDADYIARIAALPGALFSDAPAPGSKPGNGPQKPTPFKFDGGVGCIVPCWQAFALHLGDIEGLAP